MSANSTGITAACTCSVDGVSGDALTRYYGYTFTGCGAHIGYMYTVFAGAGYKTTWCYVTSPEDCPGEDPYVPEGFKDENTLLEWKYGGAAWKECYDGYRCEAWWGSMSGQPYGDPVVLNAPLDWPDCCALCSDTNINGTTTAACAGWSFHPKTGSCQLLATVSLDDNISTSWGVNRTVHGYPGYLESPVTDCWVGGAHDLCDNSALALLCWGSCFAFLGVLSAWYYIIRTPATKSRYLWKLLRGRQPSQLKRATCVEVSTSQLRQFKGTNYSNYTEIFEGTFMTQDDALFVVPQLSKGEKATSPGRSIEQSMLSVLLSENLTPLANRNVADRCRTTQGLKSEFSVLRRKAQQVGYEVRRPTIRCSEQNVQSPSFDCLLLVDRPRGDGDGRPERKALLVGILGERSITCYDGETFGFAEGTRWLWIMSLGPGIVLLIVFSGLVLENDAAQAMVARMFDGTDYRSVAAICLVVCASTVVATVAWERLAEAQIMRLIDRCPPAPDWQS